MIYRSLGEEIWFILSGLPEIKTIYVEKQYSFMIYNI